MTTDNKTLADVQPGGRVRLGDQAERARFEVWAVKYGHDLSRRPIGREGDDSYVSEHTHYAWDGWQAALSAQPSPGETLPPEMRLGSPDYLDYLDTEPSPGGQGDAPPCWWIDHGTYGQITQRQDEADAAVNAGKRVVSYAARQPVGEPVAWRYHAEGDSTKWYYSDTESLLGLYQPLYAAPQAQAVDLGQFRQPVQDWLDDAQASMEEHGDYDGVFGYAIEEGTRLLALIDSHSAGGQP